MNKKDLILERTKNSDINSQIEKFIKNGIENNELFYRLCYENPSWYNQKMERDVWYKDFFNCNEWDFRNIVLQSLKDMNFQVDERLGWVYIRL